MTKKEEYVSNYIVNNPDALRKKMQGYENQTLLQISRKTPVILRISLVNPKIFLKGMGKPFDSIFINTMRDTMQYLCEKIKGCTFGYTQQNEINLVIFESNPKYPNSPYNAQRLVSRVSSFATTSFNRFFVENTEGAIQFFDTESSVEGSVNFNARTYIDKFNTAVFDVTAFSLPENELHNYLTYRQTLAIKNGLKELGVASINYKHLAERKLRLPLDFVLGSCGKKQKVMEEEVNLVTGETKLLEKTKCMIYDETPVFGYNKNICKM